MSGPAAASRRAPKRLVLCLDGTWNNTYTPKKRDSAHYVVKPSNVLKLARAIVPRSPVDGHEQVVYYDIGVGSLSNYPGFSNRALRLADRYLGGSRGAGFEGNVEDALGFLALNHEPGDEVFIFGFSRGAATARAVAAFIAWAGGLPVKGDVYYLASLFRMYIQTRGTIPCTAFVDEINTSRAHEPTPRPELNALRPVTVTLLGVWDTVIAMGSHARPGRPDARDFHITPHVPMCVRHAVQALAIDELRYEFRPEIWQQRDDTQTLTQRWFAGVHSNVGGGYVDDGLANITFQWMRHHAEQHRLALDATFADHYTPYAEDRLYHSDSLLYRLWDSFPGRRGRGTRQLINRPAAANLTLDRSVIARIQADPTAPDPDQPSKLRYPDLRRIYRPPNVLSYLAHQPNLNTYLTELNVTQDLPSDVTAAIAAIRNKSR